MRTLVAVSVFAALSLAAAAVAAQQPTAPSTAQTDRAMNEIQITVTPSRYKPVVAELETLPGTYKLDDGATLRVARSHLHVTAALGHVGSVDLIPVGPYLFMARDRSMLVEFNIGTLGEDVIVTYNPDSVAAEQHGSASRTALR